jgi:hypothetical protein
VKHMRHSVGDVFSDLCCAIYLVERWPVPCRCSSNSNYVELPHVQALLLQVCLIELNRVSSVDYAMHAHFNICFPLSPSGLLRLMVKALIE